MEVVKGLNGLYAVPFSLDAAAAATDDDIGCRAEESLFRFFDRFKSSSLDGIWSSTGGSVDAFDDFAFPGQSAGVLENLQVADGWKPGASSFDLTKSCSYKPWDGIQVSVSLYRLQSGRPVQLR